MADYIYLLENRLSPAQQRALSMVRNAVRARDLTLFLTGGAVRDLTGGGSVRDLDITVQGETTGLQKDLEAAGATFTGEFAPSQSLFFVFSGGVRMEISAAMSVTYPKPGKPKYELTSIGEDLRRRDFTANSMALSLNEGSYGLLMDPLNGVADIENRELRLVSNYGFIEDPARMLRAIRLSSRLGWQMEARTQQRYENVKNETNLDILSKFVRGYEIEEIFYEEDPQRIMRALDGEGWLKKLAPQLSPGKANDTALADLREKQGQLQTQGIFTDSAALSFPMLTAKMPAADVAALKAAFAREGFAREIDTLEERTREFQARFSSKEASTPSAAWRMLYDAEPGLVLSMLYSAKSGSVQGRLKTFLTESPTARQRLPYAVMQEMRITPDMPVYNELLDKVFYELMDGKLATPEEMKAYLEPFSPPAPPPPLNLRRARAKKEARPSRAKAKKAAASVAEDEEAVGVAEGLMEPGMLTGPDRGDEPTVHAPLEGKVAPFAQGQTEAPEAADVQAIPEKKAAKATPLSTKLSAETGSAAAKKLTAAPVPAPEAESLMPHPEATREIAQSKKAIVVVSQAQPQKPAKAVTSSAGSVQGKATPLNAGAGSKAEPKLAVPSKAATKKPAVVKTAVAAGKAASLSGKGTFAAPSSAASAKPGTKQPAKVSPERSRQKATAPATVKSAASKQSTIKKATIVEAAAVKVPAIKQTPTKGVAAKAAGAVPTRPPAKAATKAAPRRR